MKSIDGGLDGFLARFVVFFSAHYHHRANRGVTEYSERHWFLPNPQRNDAKAALIVSTSFNLLLIQLAASKT